MFLKLRFTHLGILTERNLVYGIVYTVLFLFNDKEENLYVSHQLIDESLGFVYLEIFFYVIKEGMRFEFIIFFLCDFK